MTADGTQLVICSKSSWLPAVRREHAVALTGASAGHPVVFVERALHAAALRRPASRRQWVRGLRAQPSEPAPRVCVMPQATIVPGHLSGAAQSLDAVRLRRSLRAIDSIEQSVVVATQPWQWPAVAGAPARRRIFDCADDWRQLIPARAEAIGALYERIGREADAVILAAEDLHRAFGAAEPHIVPNGAGDELMRTPLRAPPPERRMVYAGTLSERFDVPFLRAVMERLPGWSVELYGQCQYGGRGDRPDPELAGLLETCGGRLLWHGPIARRGLADALDRGRVLIAPHRSTHTVGQDSMKLYDYAARGRPIVCTHGALGSAGRAHRAGVLEAATPEEFAAIVDRLADERPGAATRRRAWVQENGWDRRWPEWAAAAFGASTGTHS